MFIPVQEKVNDSRSGLLMILEDSFWILQPFRRESYSLSREGNGKLVTLEDEKGYPVISFLNEAKDFVNFPFYLGVYPNENNLSILA